MIAVALWNEFVQQVGRCLNHDESEGRIPAVKLWHHPSGHMIPLCRRCDAGLYADALKDGGLPLMIEDYRRRQ